MGSDAHEGLNQILTGFYLLGLVRVEMWHINFSGGPKRGFWVGTKKFMLQKFMCFFRPLSMESVKKVPDPLCG